MEGDRCGLGKTGNSSMGCDRRVGLWKLINEGLEVEGVCGEGGGEQDDC